MNHALPIHPHVGNASPTPGSLWPTPSANASREAGFMPRSIPAYVLQPTIIRPRRPAHSMHPGMSPSLRGGRRPTKQSMGSHWCLLRRCACSGRPGLLRDARNDGDFMCHCEEGVDRRSNPELAPEARSTPMPQAAPGLLRDARNDVGFLSVIARRAKTDVAIHGGPLGLVTPLCLLRAHWIASRCSQ